MPKRTEEVSISDHAEVTFEPVADNPIRHVVAINGGYDEVMVRSEFPSSTMCFFQFGALIFSVEDLDGLEEQPFIDPDDMSKLKRIQRLKLVLPVRNIAFKEESTLTGSVRRAVHDFFRQKMDDERLADTLSWFIFQEYGPKVPAWILASCPVCGAPNVRLRRAEMTNGHSFSCETCGGEIYLTDVFRLHEAVDDELGAGGILGYVTTTIEEIILVHLIRLMLKTKPALVGQILFIKDGPLAFFGQTANMHRPMRELVKHLLEHNTLYLAGLEKSGSFVEHADEITGKLDPGTILILDNDYIYRYVLPGKADPANPYGRTTYYSSKLIFKTYAGRVYVVSLPTREILAHPTENDLENLPEVLTNIEKLRCDMYDNALIPVALANKLVSLVNHPSSRILQKFATEIIHR
ncbi:MAG: NurA domain-containing protein [Actinobacteria bacterium]|nr:NurA domain-containing protein [Actinomycetota bacterium]